MNLKNRVKSLEKKCNAKNEVKGEAFKRMEEVFFDIHSQNDCIKKLQELFF